MADWNSDMAAAPRDGTWFIGKARSDDVPTVMRVTGERRRWKEDEKPDWDVQAKALNCSTSTWTLSQFEGWWPMPGDDA